MIEGRLRVVVMIIYMAMQDSDHQQYGYIIMRMNVMSMLFPLIVINMNTVTAVLKLSLS